MKDELIKLLRRAEKDKPYPDELAEEIMELIDAQRCVWTITEDDPIYGKVLSLGCDDAKHHPFFLLRLDKYPFCPCCGRKIEVKDA